MKKLQVIITSQWMNSEITLRNSKKMETVNILINCYSTFLRPRLYIKIYKKTPRINKFMKFLWSLNLSFVKISLNFNKFSRHSLILLRNKWIKKWHWKISSNQASFCHMVIYLKMMKSRNTEVSLQKMKYWNRTVLKS